MTESAKQSEQAVTMMSQRSTDGSMYTDKVVILDPKYAGIEGGARVYVEIAPTLTSRDYKDPLRVMMYETR